MLQIENYIHVSDLTEAYDVLQNEPGSVVLGGCGYLRLGARKIQTAIDISGLGFDIITEVGETIEIGAMTSLRTVETDPCITAFASGLLSESVKNIVGVQLRSCVTLGGSVAGRYPFSDPITALMALDAVLVFHHHGRVPLKEYLQGKGLKDILVKIILPIEGGFGAFKSVRKSATDYAVLNVAVVKKAEEYRIVVGSRPGKAIHVPAATDYLRDNELSQATASEAGRIGAESLQFGDNPRGSGEYRRAICPVLIKRALLDILAGKEVADAA